MHRTLILKHTWPIAVFLCALAVLAAPSYAGDWPGWRGPNHDGSTEEMNLPAAWGSTENLVWSVALPGISSATPAVWGDRVFVSTNNASRDKLSALCIDKNSGEVLWTKQLVDGGWTNARNDAASPSPVTDGERVYFLFGTSDLFALDLEGNTVWSKHIDTEYGPITPNWGYGSSPLLLDGRLIIPVLRGQWKSGIGMMEHTDDDSYVLALDAKTGEKEWKVHRPSDAVGESFDSYGTPIPFESGGKTTILIQGGDYLTAHDPATGKELWRQFHNPRQGRTDRLIPSPVIGGGMVYGIQARGLDVFAVKPGKQAQIPYEDSEWIFKGRTADVPTPLYYQDRLYVLNGAVKRMYCINPKNGKLIWEGELGASARIWSSPTAADGKIYCLDEKGQLIVIAAGDKFEVLSRGNIGGGPCKSSVAIADSKLFIRTGDTLYCVASAQAGG